MKKLLLQILCVGLILAMSAAVLTACDQGTDSPEGDSSAETTKAPATETTQPADSEQASSESTTEAKTEDTTDAATDAATDAETDAATDAATEGATSVESTEAPGTDEGTTEEDTTEDATVGGDVELEDVIVNVWDVNRDNQNAQKIDANHKGVGIAITIPEGGYLYDASVLAPSYGDDIGSLTIKVFAWNTDYETTVAGQPVFTEQFVDFADNSDLFSIFEEGQIGPGRYLILVCDGVDEGDGVGVWTGKPYGAAMPEELAEYNIESWINGKLNKKTIGKFSLTITQPEE